jgi:signal transduction histidine kinase
VEASVALRDPARLAALRATALLDSPREETFDRLTRLASKVLGVPVALVSLVDQDRQFFKSCIGLKEPWLSERGTPLSHSFCQHAVETREPLIIEDAREHPLVRGNLAIADLDVIAYAGFPLVTATGEALGTFCAIDSQPRRWTEDEVDFVREMAASAMTEIELRTTVRQLEDARAEVEGTAMTLRELQGISDAALAELDVHDLLRELLSRVTVAVDVEVAAILLPGEHGGLEVRAARGLAEPSDEAALLEAGAALLAGSEPLPALAREDQLPSGPGALRTLLAVPLETGGRPDGLLALGARTPRRFTPDELKLLELAAERAGHAMDNARLYERAQSEAQQLEKRLVATLQRQQREAEETAALRRDLLSHVVQAQEDERRRIAADVHDDYLQSLTAARMHLERLAGELGDAAESERAAALAADVGATIERMRGLVFNLRPPALDWAGIGSALRLLLEETRERCGISYALESRLDDEPPEAVRVVLYRIAQEAIANACKHAEAARVEVTLAPLDGGVHAAVRDDGRGMPAAAEPGRHSFGISGMRERAEAAGGWCRVESAPGEGTAVEFWVPAGG